MTHNKLTRNSLSESRYLISDELHKALLGEGADFSLAYKSCNDKYREGVYCVVFRVINNNNNRCLAYNYVYYHPLLMPSLLVYLYLRNMYYTLFSRELGNFLVGIDERISDKGVLHLAGRNVWNPESLFDHYTRIKELTFYDLYALFNMINYFGNMDRLCSLIDYSLRREYKSFFEVLFKGRNMEDNVNLRSDCADLRYNVLNNCMFVVLELEPFISSLSNIGYTVSGGSQKWRDQINSMNHFLNIFDMDYRNSLYNHVRRFSVLNQNINAKAQFLTKAVFSFDNIHKKLGTVRCYSTVTTTYVKNKQLNKQSFNDNIAIYNQLNEYFTKYPINNDTQLAIENFLLNYGKIISERKKEDRSRNSIINFDLVSLKFTELLHSKKQELIDYLNNFRARVYDKIPKKERELALYYLCRMLQHINNDFVIEILFGKVLIIISNNNYIQNMESKIYLEIANDVLNHYYYALYILDKNGLINKDSKYTLSEWKINNRKIVDTFNNDQMKGLIGSILGSLLIETDLLITTTMVVSKKQVYNILKLSNMVSSILDNNTIILSLPRKLPMIVKPKPYFREFIGNKTVERLGGYLLNDEKMTQSLIIDKWNLKIQSSIKRDNAVYNCINNLSCVGYKINKDVLNFLDLYGIYYNLYTYDERLESLINKSSLTKADYDNLDSYLSKKDLEQNILGIARAYSNIHEFFIPVRIDFRGRITCSSEYLNYQSSELAKSLLLFSKPERIYKTDELAISYLKAYGANCYGNNLDKDSWNNRIKWINENEQDILDFNNGKLITRAENKLLFIAFCFEYKRFLNSLTYNDNEYFDTYLPIQLDATCNGYQHLALLSSDHMLAKELNLTSSSWNDEPKDFYKFIAVRLLSIYKNILESNYLSEDLRDSYTRLANLDVDRKMLKKAIMTRSYNISPLEMIRRIQDSFKMCDNMLEVEYKERWLENIVDPTIKLKIKDFALIRLAIEEVLNSKEFKLRKLIKYLDGVAKILTKLGLVIPWGSPSGVIIQQSYLAPKQIKLKPFSYSKKSFTLHVPDTNYNKRKQIRAFMPNIIHSLDAGSLALLVDLFFSSNDSLSYKSFFSIHDCFAVTANNVETVMYLLQDVYTNIYSDNKYLRDLDKGIKNYIKLEYGSQNFNDDTLEITLNEFPPLKFPSIEAVLGKDSTAANLILDKTYIIH